jgi:glycosyltransferase involved in cell wall biosynthesis
MKAAILNNFLSTFGGGEKNTYAIAHTLARLGYEVDVLTFEERTPSASEVADFFGPGHDGFRILSLAERGLAAADHDERLTRHLRPYMLFLNQCAGSSFANPCPMGVYLVMFPFQAPGPWLASYHHYICNSQFTEFYVKQRWGHELATTVVYPPVDEPVADPDAPRAREILAIGRFTWEGHAKNQDLLVQAFDDVLDRLPSKWSLTLLGRVHEDAATLSRLEKLRRACRRLPVRFELNVSNEAKRAALRRASVFWHGTGFGRSEPDGAAKMEHFGIAVLEAMISGAIPMCYHRGGPREIVRHGESGFLYRDMAELVAFSEYVANSPRAERRLRRGALERVSRFSRERFDTALAAFMSSTIAA